MRNTDFIIFTKLAEKIAETTGDDDNRADCDYLSEEIVSCHMGIDHGLLVIVLGIQVLHRKTRGGDTQVVVAHLKTLADG